MKISNPLLLSVDIASWGIVSQEHGSLLEPTTSEILDVYRHVLQRDNHTCYYCGFASDKYQEIHHIDHNHTNNDPSNLVTVCPLCHQSHHLSLADLHNGASLIWCPELSQQEINDLCRIAFILKQINDANGINDGHYISRLAFGSIYSTLERGIGKLEEFFEGASNCGTFGQILLDIKANAPDRYMKRDQWLRGIRMLHKPMRFHVQTAYWRTLMMSNPNFRLDRWVDYTIYKSEKDKPVYTPPTDEEVKRAFQLDLSLLN